QIAAVSGLDPATQADEAIAWTETTLQNGFDLLTARGANVVWTQPQQPTTEGPFSVAMGQVESADEAVRSVTDDAARQGDVDALVASLTENQRAAGAAGPKVLVVGDSMARTMGYGL